MTTDYLLDTRLYYGTGSEIQDLIRTFVINEVSLNLKKEM